MLKRIFISLAVLPVLALISFCLIQPVFPAILCPSCLGFKNIQGNLYVEHETTPQQQERLKDTLREAIAKVEKIYGPLISNPRILASFTKKHYRFLGGGKAKAQAYGASAIQLSPEGLSSDIVAHELSHIELHKRVGVVRSYNQIPVWFDEGLAVLASNDPRYTGPEGSEDLSAEQIQEIVSPQQWRQAIRQGKKVYAPAYRIVKIWYDKAGRKGVQELILRVKDGETFKKVYEELGDRPYSS